MEVCETFSEHRVPFVLNSTPRYKTSHSGRLSWNGAIFGRRAVRKTLPCLKWSVTCKHSITKLSVLGYLNTPLWHRQLRNQVSRQEMEKNGHCTQEPYVWHVFSYACKNHHHDAVVDAMASPVWSSMRQTLFIWSKRQVTAYFPTRSMIREQI